MSKVGTDQHQRGISIALVMTGTIALTVLCVSVLFGAGRALSLLLQQVVEHFLDAVAHQFFQFALYSTLV